MGNCFCPQVEQYPSGPCFYIHRFFTSVPKPFESHCSHTRQILSFRISHVKQLKSFWHIGHIFGCFFFVKTYTYQVFFPHIPISFHGTLWLPIRQEKRRSSHFRPMPVARPSSCNTTGTGHGSTPGRPGGFAREAWRGEESQLCGENNAINHPPVITINSFYKPFPNGWLMILFYPH